MDKSFVDLTTKAAELTDTARCIKARYDNGVSNLGGGQERCRSIPIKVNRKEIRVMEEDNAMCLNARDYKGVCNQGINGVAVYPVEVSTTEVKPMENEAHALLARDYKEISTYGINGAAVKVPIRENVKKGYSEATYGDGINLTAIGSHTRRGRIGKGVAQTLDTGCNQGVLVNVDEDTQVYAVWHEGTQSYIAIRKLTPKECFRLQGWTDDYFEKAAFVNSDTQLYRQAGNGITTTVVKAIADMISEVKYED